MGLFDEIVCDYPLPGTPPEFVGPGHQFQTKDLDCDMTTYRIAEDGAFDIPDFTGTVDFYTSNIRGGSGKVTFTTDGEDAESVDYRATIVGGRLSSLVETHRSRVPALPISEMSGTQPPTDEDVRRWEDRQGESLVGRRIYVLWGGQDVGYWAEVVAESTKKLCVKSEGGPWAEAGDLEVIHRFQRDRTFFDSEEDAKRIRGQAEVERDAEQRRYEALLASRVSAAR